MGLITIISRATIFFLVPILFTLGNLALALESQPNEVTDHHPGIGPQSVSRCNEEFRATLSRQLVDYLKNPNQKDSKKLAVQLCRITPAGPTPCPININEERVADFSRVSQTNPWTVPIVACAAKMAEGEVAQELNELQARALDSYGSGFFVAWQLIPREVKSLAQNFEDFGKISPDPESSVQKKISVFQKRVLILEKAPPNLKKEFAPTLAFLKEQLKEYQAEKLSTTAGEFTLKKSLFFEQTKEKLIRITTKDKERAASLAMQVAKTEGLNYKVYFKDQKRTWNLCSTAANSADSCKVSEVNLFEGKDHCGKFGIIDVFYQVGAAWIVGTETANFRIDAPQYLTPVSILLQKGEDVMRFWNLPQGFIPKFLSRDLRTVLASTQIKTDSGVFLAELYVSIRQMGSAQIVDPPSDLKTYLPVSRNLQQRFKDVDGSNVELVLPKCQ